MNELSHMDDPQPIGQVLRSWGFWIPTLISVLATAFTAAQWLEAREQRHLAFDAALVFDVDTLRQKHRVGIGIRNVGPGVARISSVKYFVDRKPVDDPNAVLGEGKLDSNRDSGVTLDRGDSMAAGETDWLIDYRAGRRADEDRAVDFVENHLQIAIEYCSAAG